MKIKKEKGDLELIRMGSLINSFKEIERKLFLLQRDCGDPAKRRVCAYLMKRFENLIDWIKIL